MVFPNTPVISTELSEVTLAWFLRNTIHGHALVIIIPIALLSLVVVKECWFIYRPHHPLGGYHVDTSFSIIGKCEACWSVLYHVIDYFLFPLFFSCQASGSSLYN